MVVTMGRTPEPVESKRKRGSRWVPSETLPAVGRVDAAAVMDGDTLSAFQDMLERGVDWLADTDQAALVLLREHLEIVSLFKQRMSLVGADPEQMRAWNNAVDRTSKLLSRLGFDPASRSALGLAEVHRVSKLEELRQQWATEDEKDGVIDV